MLHACRASVFLVGHLYVRTDSQPSHERVPDQNRMMMGTYRVDKAEEKGEGGGGGRAVGDHQAPQTERKAADEHVCMRYRVGIQL